MKIIQNATKLIREALRAYLVINLVYYGMVVCGMIYGVSNPTVQEEVLEATVGSFTEGPLSEVASAYTQGQALKAVVLTWVVNLFIGSFAVITIPSLVIPFTGLLMGVYRAFLWGLIFSPVTPEMRSILIPTLLLIILEGQGYILAMFAAYLQGKAFLWPRTVNATTHRQGYWAGLKLSAHLYVLVAIVLAVAALYEVALTHFMT